MARSRHNVTEMQKIFIWRESLGWCWGYSKPDQRISGFYDSWEQLTRYLARMRA